MSDPLSDASATAASIERWLIADAPTDTSVVAELIGRLREAGVEIYRAATSIYTLHPETRAVGVTWRESEGLRKRLVSYEFIARQDQTTMSPVNVIGRGVAPELRERLESADSKYPALQELKAEGVTDYFITAVRPPRRPDLTLRAFFSMATRRPGGFREEELALVRRLLPALALRFELVAAYTATEQLLEVYLGQNAARRVLDGSFRRGTGELIDAAIWFCDLRGFTTLVDRNPIDSVVPALDAYFDCVAAPVTAAGGEILKFIGDAMLAIFPIAGAGAADASRRALEAATKALEAVEALSKTREGSGAPQLRIGVALHRGKVMYGNIGASNRLDFTVIGGAVNEVCRVESLCKELGTPLLATAAFADAAGREVLSSVGRFTLRGVSEQAELFTVRR